MENFVIHCVFDSRKGQADFNEMCAFCFKEGIRCVIRSFSHAFEEDKDEIIRLPAYHVFYQGDYELTFYPGDCPLATLGTVREKKKTTWKDHVFNMLGFTSKSKTKDMKNN
jgi:hypothetical protein